MSPKHTVHFSEVAAYHQVPHREEMSGHEKAEMWFSKEELSHMQLEDQQLLREVQHGTAKIDSICTRGLENRSLTGSAADSRLSIVEVICAVIDEQARQIQDKQVDPVRLAKMYKKETKYHRREAIARGQEDWEDSIAYDKRKYGSGKKRLDEEEEATASTEGVSATEMSETSPVHERPRVWRQRPKMLFFQSRRDKGRDIRV